MISVAYLALFLYGLVYCLGQVQQQEEGVAPVVKDDDRRPLTDAGFIRYGDPFYVRQSPEERRLQVAPRDPTFTNEIENSEESRKRPLFIFTTFDAPLSSQQLPPNSGPYIEIRKKRSAEAEKPSDSVVGLLRKKRSHCSKCGGGGGYGGGYGGGGYPVATYQVYPVYTSYVPAYPSYPSYGGGGGGCNTCGKGGGFGGGNSGSWSKSSSSSKSSSGSWGYGK